MSTPQPGKGTTFRIFLPRHVADAEERSRRRAAEAPASRKRRCGRGRAAAADLTGQGTILLVEDEDGLRALNARGLRSRGYTVLEAGNGVEAMEVLEEHERQGRSRRVRRGDAGDGRPDAAQGAAQAQSDDLKIIFVSGYAEDAFEKSLPEGEQFAFLPKPFTLKQLVAAVKETMPAG